jgi:hypothetical protein
MSGLDSILLQAEEDGGDSEGSSAMLGPRRQWMAGLVAAIALLSFFIPLVTTDTPVLGKTHWSAYQVFEGYLHKTLPVMLPSDPAQAHAQRVFIAVWGTFQSYQMEYLGIVVLLLAIVFYPLVKIVGGLAALIAIDLLYSDDGFGFQEGIYGEPRSFAHAGVHALPSILLLLAAAGLILLIVSWKDLDG